MNGINSDRSSVERGWWLKPLFSEPLDQFLLYQSCMLSFDFPVLESNTPLVSHLLCSLCTFVYPWYPEFGYKDPKYLFAHVQSCLSKRPVMTFTYFQNWFQRKYMIFVAFFLLQSMLNFRHLRFRLIKQGIFFYEKQHFFALNSNIYFSNTRKSMTKYMSNTNDLNWKNQNR